MTMQKSHTKNRTPRTDLPVPSREHETLNADSLGLDHLRSFLAVVETGSQARAAKRLRIAQTTVCRHLSRVQEHFGGNLFEAGSSGILSARGLLVEQSVRTAVAELSMTRERLEVNRPVLRIGFIRAMRPLVEKALRCHAKAQGAPAFDVRLQELTPEMRVRVWRQDTRNGEAIQDGRAE